MAQSLIQKLQNNFSLNYQRGSAYFLTFFKENADVFDSISSLESEDELNTYVGLTWSYTCALIDAGDYIETVDRAVKSLTIIDKEIESIPNFEKDQLYYDLLFFEAKARFILKDYRKSTQIFKRLIKSNFKNAEYYTWLNASQYYENRWIIRSIYVVSVILIITEIVFKSYFSPFMRSFILGIGIFGFIGSLTYQLYSKNRFDKTNS